MRTLTVNLLILTTVIATGANLSSEELEQIAYLQDSFQPTEAEGREKRSYEGDAKENTISETITDDTNDDESQNTINSGSRNDGYNSQNADFGTDRVFSKRFLSVFRNRPPKSEGYKRGPGFRSWGGKRSNSEFTERELSSRFNPYVKRTLPSEMKRRPFQSWGGKRSFHRAQAMFYIAPKDNLKKFMDGKRKFNSWGGKRAEEQEERDAVDDFEKRSGGSRKKPSFQSWGGKRSLYFLKN